MGEEIFQSVQDAGPRAMTETERTELTAQKNGGQGDWFARWLSATPVADRQLSLRGLLTQTLHAKPYQVFAVADGIPIIYDHSTPNNPLNSVPRRLRFVAVAIPDSDGNGVDLSLAVRTLFITGSSNLDGANDRDAYLQCASWDPHAVAKGRGLFRFYQRDSNGWVYFGDSSNAFDSGSVNHGVFEGHVGGALIMKELTRPWPHWYTGSNMANFKDSLGSTRDEGSRCDEQKILYDSLLTSEFGHPFNKLGTAETLEPVIRASVRKWYNTRYHSNFVQAPSQANGTCTAKAIKDWAGHILLSNGTNIAASQTSTAQIKENKVDVGAPPITLFLNLNALQAVLPHVAHGVRWDFTINNDVYQKAIEELQLSLYHRDDSVAVNLTEGPFAFPIIEPGIEDYQAVTTLATNSVTLLPKKAIAAMPMIDFWNPMYSVKRAKLMTYLPDTATFDAGSKTYNFLDQFIAKVQGSAESKIKDTPEYDILQMLDPDKDDWETEFTERVNTYLHAVQARLKLEGAELQHAVMDYMVVAEGRRRLYRSWQHARPCVASGLDEFKLTLPIAARPEPFPLAEMTESGEISVIESTSTYEKLKEGVERAGKPKCPVAGHAALES